MRLDVTVTTALSDGAELRVIPGDEAQSPSPVEVTAVSRIRGTQRIHGVTGGHEEDTKKIELEYRRNPADTTGHERTRPYAG